MTNYRIQKFTNAGGFLAKWAMPDGEQPYGLDVDAWGNVYVTERFHHHVNVFTGSGVLLARWGGYGGGIGQFSFPYDVAVDASGNVYVADTNNHRMVPTPTAQETWGGVKARYRPGAAAQDK